jgi:GNAT superfamily N-acetyltransferase
MTILPACPADLDAIRGLLHEYQRWIGLDLSFQGFEDELAALPGDYAPPDGRLLVAREAVELVGMVALRRHDAGRCEMKRLFVLPQARGTGLGRALAERVIDEARRGGYRAMLLDTLPMMSDAQRLYRALGFVDVPPYYDSPIAGTRFLSLDL